MVTLNKIRYEQRPQELSLSRFISFDLYKRVWLVSMKIVIHRVCVK